MCSGITAGLRAESGSGNNVFVSTLTIRWSTCWSRHERRHRGPSIADLCEMEDFTRCRCLPARQARKCRGIREAHEPAAVTLMLTASIPGLSHMRRSCSSNRNLVAERFPFKPPARWRVPACGFRSGSHTCCQFDADFECGNYPHQASRALRNAHPDESDLQPGRSAAAAALQCADQGRGIPRAAAAAQGGYGVR